LDPGQSLSWRFGPGAPANAWISGGAFSWVAGGIEDRTFTVIVTDSGSPAKSDSQTFTIHVKSLTSGKVAPSIGTNSPSFAVSPGSQFTLRLSATDPNNAGKPLNEQQKLTFSLDSYPAGATVTPSGIVSWFVPRSETPGDKTFVVHVSDDGLPSLSSAP